MARTPSGGLTRRRFLQGLGAASVGGVAAVVARNALRTAPPRARVHPPPHVERVEGALWHDAGTWPGGRVPGPGDVVQITRPVILDADARVAGLEIGPQGALVFAPQITAALESSGNVVVHGRLTMRPERATVTHTLRFVGVDESAFVGGGMDVLESDVGLWVMDAGVLDATGTPRAGWNRTGDDPTWRSDDEVRVAPQAPGDYDSFKAFRAGASVPSVSYRARVYPTEVFNLTRNVRIEGTPDGRAHVFIHAHVPQSLRFLGIRHMGPRNDTMEAQSGRYGLHFHHGGDGTRGTVVEGVVVRDCGNHAFVPHDSHGITFRDCIAFDTWEEAYWWDPDLRDIREDGYPKHASFDILYDHCAAFKQGPTPGTRNRTLGAFELGQGEGNACIDCVAVGNIEGRSASGFTWPSSANLMPNTWRFEDCVTHNNRGVGIFVWQNGGTREGPHLIDRFTAYHCGNASIDHGAYRNRYIYRDATLFGCGRSVRSHAMPNGEQRWERVMMPDGLSIAPHSADPTDGPVVMVDCSISEVVVSEAPGAPGRYDLIRCGVEPADFAVDFMHPDSMIRVQREDGTAFKVVPDGVEEIAAFA